MQVLAAQLIYEKDYWTKPTTYNLKVKYTESDFENFISLIDFVYDNGYGRQLLLGYIWFTDGTWAERYEYDGAECWVIKECPIIPNELL